MLQQTTVAAAAPYWRRFLDRWPTVEALASADDAEVMQAWAGLGYYARARNLLACARTVVAEHGGRFPDAESELRQLPGVGAYTAAAVASIAFGRRAVVVDGNVERVMARLFAIDEPLPAARPRLRALAGTLTPDVRPGDYAQAVMDLGATICTPRSPACALCPWMRRCHAHAEGRQAELPRRSPKAVRELRRGVAWWLEAAGAVLLVRRPARGLLGGMLAPPCSGFAANLDVANTIDGMPLAADWTILDGHVAHGFTHFDLRLHVRRAVLAERVAIEGGRWIPIGDIAGAGLPTLFARAAELATGLPIPRPDGQKRR